MSRIESNGFPVSWARSQFPAILRGAELDPARVSIDNAAGTQMPEAAIEAGKRFIIHTNALPGAYYGASDECGRLLDRERSRVAKLLSAGSADEVIIGPNATTLLRLFSTAFEQSLRGGDEIIVSLLEHEANVTPWLRLQLAGVEIKYWEPRGPHARLYPGDLKALLSDRTRLVAVTGASNLLGTFTDLDEVAQLAHDAGALVCADGVHATPHTRIDLSGAGIDFFVFSAYKFFGPHVGFAVCRRELMDRLPSLNHFFLDKWKLEIGAPCLEGVAAMEGTLDYLEDLAARAGCANPEDPDQLMAKIRQYERSLSERAIEGLSSIDGLRLYGVNDPDMLELRAPTFAFTVDSIKSEELARRLGRAGFAVRCGDMYAARIVEWLKLDRRDGVVRASFCHYNTLEEVEAFVREVDNLVRTY